MPLHPYAKPPIRRIHRLDHPIGSAGQHRESDQRTHRLMVGGVAVATQRFSQRRRSPRLGNQGVGRFRGVVGLFMPLNVLNQRATQRHDQRLHTPTKAQKRQRPGVCHPANLQFHIGTFVVYTIQPRGHVLPVVPRMNVERPAGHDHPVDKTEERHSTGHIAGGQQDRDSARVPNSTNHPFAHKNFGLWQAHLARRRVHRPAIATVASHRDEGAGGHPGDVAERRKSARGRRKSRAGKLAVALRPGEEGRIFGVFVGNWTNVGAGAWVRVYDFRGNPLNTVALDMGKGDVMVVSPGTAIPEEDFAELDKLGTVKALVSPGAFHHLGFPEWVKRYPEAGLYGPNSAIGHVAKQQPTLKPLQGLDALKPMLSDEFEVDELGGCKHPDLFLSLRRDGAVSWVSNEILTNAKDYPGNLVFKWIFQLTGNHPGLNTNSLAAMLIGAKKPAVRQYLEGKLKDLAPTRLLPVHGEILNDPELGTKIGQLLAARF